MAEMKTRNGNVPVKIVQWCNDWFIVDIPGVAKNVTCNPTKLTLTTREANRVRKSIEAGQAGQMGSWFELQDDGKFKRKKRSLSND